MLQKKSLDDLHRLSVNEFAQTPKIPVVIILDNIRSAMNVGSFFRTADAFRIHEVVLCGITATPPHKEILKTAIGANLSVSWKYEFDICQAVQQCKQDDFLIIGIEQTTHSISLQDFQVSLEHRYALIFGNEVEGISDQVLPMLDGLIELPQFGTKHSLNVAVCGGIVLWHFCMPYLQRIH